MLMGSGFGGAAGFLGMLLQVALIAGLAMLAMRFFARRQQSAASGPAGASPRNAHEAPQQQRGPSFQIPKIGSLGDAATAPAETLRQASEATDEIGVRSEEHTSELQSLMRISYA